MKRPEILDTAKKMVCGDRETDYGRPESNFSVIADLWSAYKGVKFSALDVAMMMTLLKLGRIKTGTAKNDSFVDAAGYIACGGEIATEEKSSTVGTPAILCCDHDWESCGASSAGLAYRCRKCGATKVLPPYAPTATTATTRAVGEATAATGGSHGDET